MSTLCCPLTSEGEKNHFFEDNNVNVLAREDRWFQTGSVVFEQRRWSTTLLTTHLRCCTLQDILTTIHTWAHLALATHINVGQVNHPQL